VRLFGRQGNTLSITEAGRLMQGAALTMLRAEEHATRPLVELSVGTRGTLAIGANTTGGMYVVPQLIGAFRDATPRR
jgi:DNA-binding transcriptional LysR family regulator